MRVLFPPAVIVFFGDKNRAVGRSRPCCIRLDMMLIYFFSKFTIFKSHLHQVRGKYGGKKTKQIPSFSTPTKWWTKWYKMVSFLITSHHNSPLAWLRLMVHRSSGSCWSHPSEPVGLGVFPKDSGFFCPKMDGFISWNTPIGFLMDDLGGKLPPLLFGNILSYLHYRWQVQKMPENFQSRVFSWIFLFVGLPTCLNIQRF